MEHFFYLSRRLLLILLLSGIIGCASLPREVVTLSYYIGEDLSALHQSYDKLIYEFYEKLRAERTSYLDETWYPRFLENWMESGQLVSITKGEMIWSEEQQKLIPTPPGTDSKETFQTLRDWVDFALYAYEVKEQELVKPLNDEESALRQEIQKAFQQIMRANATITAHLNSIREIKEVQNEALEALHIREFRNKINDTLVNASERAAKELDKIRRIDKSIDNLDEQVKSLIEEIKE